MLGSPQISQQEKPTPAARFGTAVEGGEHRGHRRRIVEDRVVGHPADRVAAEKMQSLTEGLPLPPGMKLPF